VGALPGSGDHICGWHIVLSSRDCVSSSFSTWATNATAAFNLHRRARLRPGTLRGYALAFVSVGAVAVLRLAVDPFISGVPFITFWPAVIITVLISGLGAGLLCVVVSVATADFFELPRRRSFYAESPADVGKCCTSDNLQVLGWRPKSTNARSSGRVRHKSLPCLQREGKRGEDRQDRRARRSMRSRARYGISVTARPAAVALDGAARARLRCLLQTSYRSISLSDAPSAHSTGGTSRGITLRKSRKILTY
jgi:hypothetical protein